MRKRGISELNENNNFFGYEVNNEGFLVFRTKFECKTECIELNRYCRKLNIKLRWRDNKALVIFDNNSPWTIQQVMQKIWVKLCWVYPVTVKSSLWNLSQSVTLRPLGAFLQIRNIDEKISRTNHYNRKLNDQLLTFCVKVRLNILPTNFTLFMWNPKNKPRCPFCNHATKSMAHLLNRCQREFGNFYSRRHNRIADYLYEQFKTTDRRYKTYNNKHIDTIMAQHRERLVLCNNRCYDLYFNSHEMVKLKNIHR